MRCATLATACTTMPEGDTTTATIRARKKADGTVSYTAQIRIKKNSVQVYQESQTFARRKATEAWARRRERELDGPGAIERRLRDQLQPLLLRLPAAAPAG